MKSRFILGSLVAAFSLLGLAAPPAQADNFHWNCSTKGDDWSCIRYISSRGQCGPRPTFVKIKTRKAGEIYGGPTDRFWKAWNPSSSLKVRKARLPGQFGAFVTVHLYDTSHHKKPYITCGKTP